MMEIDFLSSAALKERPLSGLIVSFAKFKSIATYGGYYRSREGL